MERAGQLSSCRAAPQTHISNFEEAQGAAASLSSATQDIPSLTECEVALRERPSAIPPGFLVIINPNIRSFTVEAAADLGQLLDHSNLPALAQLSIRLCCDIEWPGDALNSMMSRSACRLTSLKLLDMGCKYSEDETISHFEHESTKDTLIELSLHMANTTPWSLEYVITDPLLDFLTCHEDRAPQLPQLKSLQISLLLSENSTKCKEMVLSRKPDVARGIAGFESLYILMYPVREFGDLNYKLGDVRLKEPYDLEEALEELRDSPHTSHISWDVLARSDYFPEEP